MNNMAVSQNSYAELKRPERGKSIVYDSIHIKLWKICKLICSNRKQLTQ